MKVVYLLIIIFVLSFIIVGVVIYIVKVGDIFFCIVGVYGIDVSILMCMNGLCSIII